MNTQALVRHDWTISEITPMFEQPILDLLLQAQRQHRQYFEKNTIQLSTLLSIKTGACPEDCKYCSQSGHYKTAIEKEKLLELNTVIERAKQAKANGASRFCMGAAWRSPPKKALPALCDMIKEVKSLGLETCLTAGMLNQEQAATLKEAGLDYYNHNLDTSPEYYKEIISTRTYQDRLNTLEEVRQANIKTCCGGIIGLGESREDRCELLLQLANLPKHPESVPINLLVPIKGTPLGEQKALDALELVRTIAVARLMLPKSVIRLSAGRQAMSQETHALCFMAGANSIFSGEKLLTTDLPSNDADTLLFKSLGLSTQTEESMLKSEPLPA